MLASVRAFFHNLQGPMVAPVRAFAHKLREPIVTNRGLDLLAAYLWATLAWWGINATITGIPTVTMAASPLYELIWGGAIGVLSLVAAFAAASTFFRIPRVSRAMKRWVELSAVMALTGLISVYPTLLIIGSLNGDEARVATVGLGFFVLGFPIWRITHTVSRIRALAIAGDTDSNG